MATKRRTDYQVDEEALKRMMAGDVTALDKMASPAEAPETKRPVCPFPREAGEELRRFSQTADRKIHG